MKKKMIRFPSIESFRHVCESVGRHSEFEGFDAADVPIINPDNPRPTIEFAGTVKLHGTNAGVAWNGEELWAQSRTSVITTQNDNAGFAFFVESNKEILKLLMKKIKDNHKVAAGETLVVYGEWCGKGIQKGTAINQLDKMFVIFGVKIATSDNDEEANRWIDYDVDLLAQGEKRSFIDYLTDYRIYFIQSFPQYNITIDFNEPEKSSEELTELTTKVENQCPVGGQLGATGIGEGIVWIGTHDENRYIFKVKGEKHQVAGKQKVKKDLAPADVEKLNSVNEFIEYAVTENRLEQGLQEVFISQNKQVDRKGIADFLKWVQADVIKEEMDTLVKNGLEPKDVNGALSKKAVKWFMPKCGV